MEDDYLCTLYEQYDQPDPLGIRESASQHIFNNVSREIHYGESLISPFNKGEHGMPNEDTINPVRLQHDGRVVVNSPRKRKAPFRIDSNPRNTSIPNDVEWNDTWNCWRVDVVRHLRSLLQQKSSPETKQKRVMVLVLSTMSSPLQE